MGIFFAIIFLLTDVAICIRNSRLSESYKYLICNTSRIRMSKTANDLEVASEIIIASIPCFEIEAHTYLLYLLWKCKDSCDKSLRVIYDIHERQSQLMALLFKKFWYTSVGIVWRVHTKMVIKNPLRCRGCINKMNIKLSLCVKRSDNNNDVVTRSHKISIDIFVRVQTLFLFLIFLSLCV